MRVFFLPRVGGGAPVSLVTLGRGRRSDEGCLRSASACGALTAVAARVEPSAMFVTSAIGVPPCAPLGAPASLSRRVPPTCRVAGGQCQPRAAVTIKVPRTATSARRCLPIPQVHSSPPAPRPARIAASSPC
jgi:hypothetical protein